MVGDGYFGFCDFLSEDVAGGLLVASGVSFDVFDFWSYFVSFCCVFDLFAEYFGCAWFIFPYDT